MPQQKLALVLGGGGNLGVVQVAFIEALAERGVRPDLVVGTSVGSLNAAYVAFQDPTRNQEPLGEIWVDLRGQRLLHRNAFRIVRRLFRNRLSLYSDQFVTNLVRDHLDADDFANARIPLLITATNLSSGEPAVLSEGSVQQAILASTAIPGIFPPVEIDDDWYVDGGVAYGLGVEAAVDHGATSVLTVDLSSGMAYRQPRGLVDVLARSYAIMGQRRTTCLLEHSGLVAKITVWRPGLTAPHGPGSFDDMELLLSQARELAGPLIDLSLNDDGTFAAGVYEGSVRRR